MLSQCVSSELDADRMDYLRRDAYYCGVSYGAFDHEWLVKNLRPAEWDGRHVMALQHKGVWAFEHFLLSRYHMFLAVYYHHTPTCFDHLLGRYYEGGEYELPADSSGYLDTDDVHLLAALRRSKSDWARAVVRRHGYRLLVETHTFGDDAEDAALDERLAAAGIDFFRVRSKGTLSKYFRKRDKVFPLVVIEPELGRVKRIEEYTPLYERFNQAVALSRVYCKPEQLGDARPLIK
jgi:HD superfamily phosphohydrolase